MSIPLSTKPLEAFALDALSPQQALAPSSEQEASELLARANEREESTVFWGGGTHVGVGNQLKKYDLAVSQENLNRIVSHQPEEMIVTIQSGVTLAQLQSALKAKGQFLPWNPSLPEKATLGGLIATNGAGSWRFGNGTPRDHLLELRAVMADGTRIKGGAKVVKSVAGYDMPRLFCNSWGTLGLIVEATLKIRPLPEAFAALFLPLPLSQLEEAVGMIFEAPLEAIALDWLNEKAALEIGQSGNGLILAFEGLQEAVTWQKETIRTLLNVSPIELEENALSILQNQTAPRSPVSVRFVTSSSRVSSLCALIQEAIPEVWVVAHAGSGIVYCHAQEDDATTLLSIGQQFQARFVFTSLPLLLKQTIASRHDPGAELGLMHEIKRRFDPRSVLSPGRFLSGV